MTRVIVSTLLLSSLLSPSCDSSHATWTYEGAISPTLSMMDRNSDGMVDRSEYEAHSYYAPAFQSVDSNDNGELDVNELEQLVLSTDPVAFDGCSTLKPITITLNPNVFHPGSFSTRVLKELFTFMLYEVHARNPEYPLPSEEEIQAAANTRTLDSPASSAVLESLLKAYDEVSLSPPSHLLAH